MSVTQKSKTECVHVRNQLSGIHLWKKEKFNRWRLFLFAVSLLVSAGCAERAVENAFQGEYSTVKNNQIINEYCQSCHLHKDFDPKPHISEMRVNYKRTFFRKAKSCRSCHYIEKNWIHDQYMRKTRMPRDANRGEYRDFEKEELKKNKKG